MTKHPAKFNEAIARKLAEYLNGAATIADPFAGTGRVGWLKRYLLTPATIYANEIETEWALQAHDNGCDHVTVGDARRYDALGSGRLHGIATSPTYGNRMADSANWSPDRRHSTYHSALGRRPSSGSSAVMHWDEPYRELHREVWRRAWDWLIPGGRLALNIKDHIVQDVPQRVPEWHVSALVAIGFVLRDWCEAEAANYGFGANAEKRLPEIVILFEKPGGEYGVPPWLYQPVPGGSGGLWAIQPEPVQLSLLEVPHAH